jgi:hypothetical protein
MPEATNRPSLSAEAQHVIDSLEAHLGAIVKAAQSQSPALVAEVAKFGDAALGKLEAWGLTLRGEVQALENPANAAPAGTFAGSNLCTGPAAAAPVGAAPAGIGAAFAAAAPVSASPPAAT